MAIVSLGSNIQSLRAQLQLANASSTMSKTLEALSSGLRINRAGDDAAGLAIASGLKTDERVFIQGVRNLNDGISLLNIADGALGELTGIVIRLQELAEQAANGTLGVAQRKALDTEAQALSKEYTRIVQSTEFNGRKLFSGGFGLLTLQAGYGTYGSITSGLGGAIGDGTFQANQDFGTSTNPRAVAVGDFNGDGTQDLVAANSGSNTVSVLLGNGDATFQPKQDFATGSSPFGVAIGDFNGDGTQDLVAANFAAGTGSTVSVLLGNGNGTFQAEQAFGTGTGPRAVAVGDFNGDGMQDLVAANFSSSTVSVLLGNGNGTFQAKQDFGTGSGPISLATADFNGDGKQDLVAANNSSNTVSVLLGNGDGTFRPKQDFGTGLGPQPVAIGDFNGDGKEDLVAANSISNTVSVLLGYGDGTFQPKQDFGTGSNPRSVTTGDFDGDGVDDLVIGNVSSNTVSVLTGTNHDGVAPLLPFSLQFLYQARQAIPQLGQALNRISAQRGVIGAFQSRLDTGLSNLQSATENSAAAGSRITDADIAAESATLVRSRILQQASAAILAQANQQPAIALKLLEG